MSEQPRDFSPEWVAKYKQYWRSMDDTTHGPVINGLINALEVAWAREARLTAERDALRTVAEAAKKHGVPPKTIYRWQRAREG